MVRTTTTGSAQEDELQSPLQRRCYFHSRGTFGTILQIIDAVQDILADGTLDLNEDEEDDGRRATTRTFHGRSSDEIVFSTNIVRKDISRVVIARRLPIVPSRKKHIGPWITRYLSGSRIGTTKHVSAELWVWCNTRTMAVTSCCRYLFYPYRHQHAQHHANHHAAILQVIIIMHIIQTN